MKKSAAELQREYYSRTAESYDAVHAPESVDNEHDFALRFLSSVIELYSIKSILDVGAGTGRTLYFIAREHPEVKIVGIEPVTELREQGYAKGISRDILIDGNGYNMQFHDREFDLVCEFGMLHHVQYPERVVGEMLRVAGKGIFISDSNNFGQGGRMSRLVKQALNALKLWPVYNFIRTGGKGYYISEGDGLFYSYSVFNNYKQIRKDCARIHLLNTKEAEYDLYKSAGHVALLALK